MSWDKIMDADHYQSLAVRTFAEGQSREDALAGFGLGLTGEAGEVADILKKHLYHGHDLDMDALEKELGDVLWYLTALCEVTGLTLADVMVANIEKLKARYPDGFSKEASINRGEK